VFIGLTIGPTIRVCSNGLEIGAAYDEITAHPESIFANETESEHLQVKTQFAHDLQEIAN
jgi:hypothetical protein